MYFGRVDVYFGGSDVSFLSFFLRRAGWEFLVGRMGILGYLTGWMGILDRLVCISGKSDVDLWKV